MHTSRCHTRSSPPRRRASIPSPGTALVPALALLFVLAACGGGETAPAGAGDSTEPTADVAENPLQERLARVIREYDAQGNHRTGSDVDEASARWLADLVREAGFEPRLEPLPFAYTEVEAAWVELPDGTRLEGFPLLDSPLTGPEGVEGVLGDLAPASEIAFFRSPPVASYDQDFLRARRWDFQRAILAVTGGAEWEMPEGLVLINADRYVDPYGVPVLQLPSESWDALAAVEGESVRVVTDGERIPKVVYNVTTTVPGTDPTLAPIVVMTPRSGWWACASERGGGLALWVELLRVLAELPPARSVHFVASTGHELGHLGLDAYLEENRELIAGADLWIHLGANFAAAVQPALRLQASDQELLDAARAQLAEAGVEPAQITPVEDRPYGEARDIFDGGGSYVSILGQNGLFHHPDDRWPQAVDLDRLERVTRAMVELVAERAGAGS